MNTALERQGSNSPGTPGEWESLSWFATPGDLDDFIFFWDDGERESEK